MISSEVTILFEKACQSKSHFLPLALRPLTNSFPPIVFIQELTARSHLNSLSSRRRTLSRPDVAQAIAKSDMFDFLIDIVPREEGLIIGGSLGDSRAGGGGGVITGKIGKKNGRGKGKKNKSDTKKRLERREESSEFGDEGEGEGLERGEGSSNKRARIDDDYVSSLMGEGLIHHDLGPEEEEEAEEEEEEEELMLEIGDGSNTSTTLSPVRIPYLHSLFNSGSLLFCMLKYANVEVIDWTANDFKIVSF